MGIILDFKINQDYISDVFCINKDLPTKLCNGKCYLTNKLKKAEEQEQNQIPQGSKERFEVVYYIFEPSPKLLLFTVAIAKRITTSYEDNFLSPLFIDEVFHPPQL